ncbi:MAG: hypothetical protein Q3M24_14730 [Candidatus Electrothrix aestuarii]|uniref:Ammonium Transporter Family n=1 Tax=Candidatus Electrothrix aestuarii TaxID=3062594 RepID=A0AAU8LRL8_9BACT|nr:hypothetical protein [Candidatus Electrothrix aestuarii]
MKNKTLTTGILIILALTPTFVGAADEAMTVQSHLNSIWNLFVGALIFFMKSRKNI